MSKFKENKAYVMMTAIGDIFVIRFFTPRHQDDRDTNAMVKNLLSLTDCECLGEL